MEVSERRSCLHKPSQVPGSFATPAHGSNGELTKWFAHDSQAPQGPLRWNENRKRRECFWESQSATQFVAQDPRRIHRNEKQNWCLVPMAAASLLFLEYGNGVDLSAASAGQRLGRLARLRSAGLTHSLFCQRFGLIPSRRILAVIFRL